MESANKFEITVTEPRERICCVTVTGRIAAAADEFEHVLVPLMKDERYDECILDCRGVEYVSSSGLRSLMKALQARKAAGKAQLICRVAPKSMFHDSLVMVGLSGYLTIRAG